MAVFPPATLRRLQQLPQIPDSVWEGDRRPLQESFSIEVANSEAQEGECILWVDGSQGVVRSMDVVSAEVGVEAMVRSLLQAMERPHSSQPSRPRKIVVRDRQVQFFLRGVLQDLDIKVECEPDLPLIDEIFRSFEQAAAARDQGLPPELEEELEGKAALIWQDAPWSYLEDHQAIQVDLQGWADTDPLYASIMGNLGMEYGVLLYRSLESLKQFRHQVVSQEDQRLLEEAFLSQDCVFLTYAAADEEHETLELAELPFEAIEPTFGTIHPLEGLRPLLHEDEATGLSLVLEALHRFFQQHGRHLRKNFTSRSGQYRIPLPLSPEADPVTVQVKSLPNVADELMALMEEAEDWEDDEDFPGGISEIKLREDLVPHKAHLYLGMIPWEVVEHLREAGHSYANVTPQKRKHSMKQQGDGLPVVIVQTSRPKAKTMIEQLQAAGGPEGICFNTGVDPVSGERYDLEIIKMANGELCLFGEFPEEDPVHAAARKKWDRRCQQTGGYCGLIIAMGVTSASKANGGIQLRHMLALYEVEALQPPGLGLGPMIRFGGDFDMGLF